MKKAKTKREVKEEVAKEAIVSVKRAVGRIKAGKQKPMELKEFDEWCKSL